MNDDDLAYAKIRLDEQSLATAIEHLGAFADALPRSLVWSAAWDMTRDGELGARSFADLVLSNFATDDDPSVAQTLLRQLASALDVLRGPAAPQDATGERPPTAFCAARDRCRRQRRPADPGPVVRRAAVTPEQVSTVGATFPVRGRSRGSPSTPTCAGRC